jgi:hypothetical protein
VARRRWIRSGSTSITRAILVHRDGERLGAAHAAEPGGDDEAPGESATEMRRASSASVSRALQDVLRADVDPAAGRHLAASWAAVLEIAEDVPGGPGGHEEGVRDDDPRGPGVRAEDGDGLARLDEQRLIVVEPAERRDDRVERGPGSRGATRSAIHDEILRPFRHLGIEVVHQHAQGGLLLPPFAGNGGAARRTDVAAQGRHRIGADVRA